MELQVQCEADCTKEHRLGRINPGAFVHKMTISNDRIIAVFQEVSFFAVFVWAAVNLLKAPAQHNTGVGRAQDFTPGPGFPGRGRGSGAQSRGCAVGQEVLPGMCLSGAHIHTFWECRQDLEAALLPFLMGLFT